MLDHPDTKAAGGGVERTPRTGHSGADDHDVELVVVEVVEGASACGWSELGAVGGIHGAEPIPPASGW